MSSCKTFVDKETGEFAKVCKLNPKRCPNGHILYYRDITNFSKKKGFNCSVEECEYFEKVVY